MKIYGYESQSEKLCTLEEVTFQSAPEELRALASFFMRCADEIEKDKGWEHEHLADFEAQEMSFPDIVVCRMGK